MPFVMYWRTVDYGHGRAETRVPCALLPYCECGGAQNDEGKANAAAAREFFVEGQAREQYRNKDRELVDLYHDAYLPGGNGVVVEQHDAPVAMPDAARNASSCRSTHATCSSFPLAATIAHAMASTTQVRIAVARLDSTPSIANLARMDVSAAKRRRRWRKRAKSGLASGPRRLTVSSQSSGMCRG